MTDSELSRHLVVLETHVLCELSAITEELVALRDKLDGLSDELQAVCAALVERDPPAVQTRPGDSDGEERRL